MDYSTLTNDELDEIIFKKRGWVKLPFPAYPKWQRPVVGEVNECWYGDGIPHPTTDPRYAMELLEELLSSGNIVKLSNGDGDSRDIDIFIVHKLLAVNIRRDIHVSTNDAKRTISEAWLQWDDAK